MLTATLPVNETKLPGPLGATGAAPPRNVPAAGTIDPAHLLGGAAIGCAEAGLSVRLRHVLDCAEALESGTLPLYSGQLTEELKQGLRDTALTTELIDLGRQVPPNEDVAQVFAAAEIRPGADMRLSHLALYAIREHGRREDIERLRVEQYLSAIDLLAEVSGGRQRSQRETALKATELLVSMSQQVCSAVKAEPALAPILAPYLQGGKKSAEVAGIALQACPLDSSLKALILSILQSSSKSSTARVGALEACVGRHDTDIHAQLLTIAQQSRDIRCEEERIVALRALSLVPDKEVAREVVRALVEPGSSYNFRLALAEAVRSGVVAGTPLEEMILNIFRSSWYNRPANIASALTNGDGVATFMGHARSFFLNPQTALQAQLICALALCGGPYHSEALSFLRDRVARGGLSTIGFRSSVRDRLSAAEAAEPLP